MYVVMEAVKGVACIAHNLFPVSWIFEFTILSDNGRFELEIPALALKETTLETDTTAWGHFFLWSCGPSWKIVSNIA